MTRPQIVRRIRLRAELARERLIAPPEDEQDPDPEIPEVLQTVRPRDYREVSLILDT